MSGWTEYQDEQFLHVHRVPVVGQGGKREGEVIPVAEPQWPRSLATSHGICGNYVLLFQTVVLR